MVERLIALGFGGNFMRVLASMYRKSCIQFLVDGKLTPSIPTHKGVLQGDPFSPTLFGVYIDTIMDRLRATGARGGNPCFVQVGSRTVLGLLYADDLVLLSLNALTAQAQLDTLAEFCIDAQLEVGQNRHCGLQRHAYPDSGQPTAL
jgi:hypothetical protein